MASFTIPPSAFLARIQGFSQFVAFFKSHVGMAIFPRLGLGVGRGTDTLAATRL